LDADFGGNKKKRPPHNQEKLMRRGFARRDLILHDGMLFSKSRRKPVDFVELSRRDKLVLLV